MVAPIVVVLVAILLGYGMTTTQPEVAGVRHYVAASVVDAVPASNSVFGTSAEQEVKGLSVSESQLWDARYRETVLPFIVEFNGDGVLKSNLNLLLTPLGMQGDVLNVVVVDGGVNVYSKTYSLSLDGSIVESVQQPTVYVTIQNGLALSLLEGLKSVGSVYDLENGCVVWRMLYQGWLDNQVKVSPIGKVTQLLELLV